MKQGWEIKKLGDICTIKGRIGFRGYTRNDLVEEGEGAITLSPSNIVNDVINFDKCQYISWYKYDESPEIQIFEGDVIYAKTASIGKVAIIKHLPEKATINPQFVVFKDIKCNHDFLYYAVRGNGFKEQVSLIINGVAIPTISQSNMAKLTIPVPPIAEQERIVAELDCLSGIIEKKKQQLKELDNLAQSIFYEMFGDPVENDKGWEVKKLSYVCPYITDGSHYSPRAEDIGEIPMLSVKDMRQNRFSYDNCKMISYDEYLKLLSAGCKPNKGDVLIAKDGSYFKYIFEVKEDREQAVLSSIAIVRPDMNLINSSYLVGYLSTSDIYKYVERELLTGTAIKRVILKGLRNMKVIIPPLSLQQDFASKIEAIEKQKELIAQSIKETETLFNSRMDYYFN